MTLSGLTGYTKDGCIRLTNTLQLGAPQNREAFIYLFIFKTKEVQASQLLHKIQFLKNHWNLNKNYMETIQGVIYGQFGNMLCGLG